MDVVDRVSATDRAVAAYRRFVSADTLDVVPDMISDLLHWYRIMLDTHVSVDALRGFLDSALDQYTSELERFGIGDDPLTGNRRAPNATWGVRDEEPVYSPRAEYPSSFAEASAFDMPIPESSPRPDEAELHPGFDLEAGCNCLECMNVRAEDRGLMDTGGGRWVPRDLYEAQENVSAMAERMSAIQDARRERIRAQIRFAADDMYDGVREEGADLEF